MHRSDLPATGTDSLTHTSTRTAIWPYGLALWSGAIAMGVIPPFGNFYGVDMIASSVLIRALLCGAAVGLALIEAGPIAAGVVGLIASIAGSLAVVLIEMFWVDTVGGVPSSAGSLGITVLVATGIAALVPLLLRHASRRIVATVGVAVVIAASSWMYGTWGTLEPLQARHESSLIQPVALGSYDFDGDLYMRVDQELKAGRSFYDVFPEAVEGDARRAVPITSAFNVRQPWLFWFFEALPGPPAALLWWFAAFWSLVAAVAFLTGMEYGGPGVGVAVGSLVAMMGFPAVWLPPQWFVFPEFWAGGMLVLSFYLLWRDRPWASVSAFIVAVAFRELAIVLAPAYLAWWWLAHREGSRDRASRGWAFPVVAALGPVLLLGAHLSRVPSHTGGSSLDISAWLHGGIGNFMSAMSFQWAGGVPGLQWTGVLLPFAAALGAVLMGWRPRSAALLAAVVFPSAFLLLFGASQPGSPNYWGAFVTPLFATFSLLPIALVARRHGEGRSILGGERGPSVDER